MRNITVDKNIRMEPVKLWMAEEIFSTIHRDREYLETWLPFVEMTKHISDTEDFIQSIINQPDKTRDEVYSIWYDEEFAGLIGFKDTDRLNQKTELGYWLAEEMQGKGIASLCVEKLMKFAFQKLKVNRIQIKVALGNDKSAAIPKRLGFQMEGIERAGERHSSGYFDLQVFSLLKSDRRP